jgi:hypothetical protein
LVDDRVGPVEQMKEIALHVFRRYLREAFP